MPLGLNRIEPACRPKAIGRSAFRLTLGLLASTACAQITAPAYNWTLPVFTKEGYRSMLARGTEARAIDPHQFEVADLNLTMFSSDAATTVENIILSPLAVFLPEAKMAHGEKGVRFIGKGVEASGMRWVYLHDSKKISLDGSVSVTFNAELQNLLK